MLDAFYVKTRGLPAVADFLELDGAVLAQGQQRLLRGGLARPQGAPRSHRSELQATKNRVTLFKMQIFLTSRILLAPRKTMWDTGFIF